MTRFCVHQIIDERHERDPGFREHVECGMKRELGEALAKEIPLNEPTMVRIRRDERPTTRPFAVGVPIWMADPATEIRYEFELRACHSMDQIITRPVYRDPEPEIRYVDRVVYIEKPKPPPPPPRTGWQKFCDFLDYIAPEVKYDGGYGNP